MPDAETDSGWRSGRTLAKLFWFGVGLAPLAALLLLVGGGASLRVAGVLAVLAVVLIGLSIALRPDNSTIRLQFEETLLEEIDNLREEVREEVASATRVSHQSFGERVGALQQQVEALRAEQASAPVAAVAAAPVPPPPQNPPAQVGRAPYPPSAAVAQPYSVPASGSAAPRQAPAPAAGTAPPRSITQQPATPPATGSARPLSAAPGRSGPAAAAGRAPASSAPSGRAPGSGAPTGRAPASSVPPGRAAISGAAPNGREAPGPDGAQRRTSRRSARPADDPPPRRASSGRANVPGGVYRRTETVQVTRSTSYVDEPPRDHYHDNGYDRRDDSGQDWSTGGGGESWTDQKLRERYGGGRQSRSYDTDGDGSWSRDDGRWSPVSAEPISGEPVSSRPISGEPISAPGRRPAWADEDSVGLRIGERWAAVRSDDRGRELRVGERRASRHTSEHGAEFEYEDRWASMHRGEDPLGSPDLPDARTQPDGRHRNGRDASRYRDDTNGRDLFGDVNQGYSSGRDYGRRDAGVPDYSRPALPAAGAEPSWNDSWEEPVRSGRSHRYRDEETNGRSYHTGSQRRLDFELSDERWR